MYQHPTGRRDPSINPSSSLEPQGQGIECGPMGQGKEIHIIHTRTLEPHNHTQYMYS